MPLMGGKSLANFWEACAIRARQRGCCRRLAKRVLKGYVCDRSRGLNPCGYVLESSRRQSSAAPSFIA